PQPCGDAAGADGCRRAAQVVRQEPTANRPRRRRTHPPTPPGGRAERVGAVPLAAAGDRPGGGGGDVAVEFVLSTRGSRAMTTRRIITEWGYPVFIVIAYIICFIGPPLIGIYENAIITIAACLITMILWHFIAPRPITVTL